MERKSYEAPVVQACSFSVEKGFATSVEVKSPKAAVNDMDAASCDEYF